MRRTIPMSLVVLAAVQTACARDEATAPHVRLGPAAQAVSASNVLSKIAFIGCGPCSDVFVIGPDGTGRTPLTRSGVTNFEPSFSPDGRQIAFSRWVASERALANIFVISVDGSGLTELKGPGFDGEPSWSPDGQRIAFVSNRDGNHEIYVMNADGSAPTRLTNDPAGDFDPSWSPDGLQIAFQREGDIYLMAPDGSGVTRVTDHPAHEGDPAWSPDGRQIAFTSDRDGNAEIYVMNADGSSPTRLTNHPARDLEPSWSPDGLQIAFQSNRDGISTQIYIMNADGSGPQRLTSGPSSNFDPSWGPSVDQTPPDQTPPQLSLPGDFAVRPERWFGELTGYDVSATDDFDPDPDIVCTPPSPSVFPIGTTEVHCTATDLAGNTATGSFLLTVRDQYAELAFDVANLEGTINDPSDDKLVETLAKLQAAREEFARTPTDRLAALRYLLNALGNLSAALDEGEISRFGFDVIGRRFAANGRLTADQAIAEAKARGGNAEAIAKAEAALATGDSRVASTSFLAPQDLQDALAQYRKACSLATGA